MHPKSRSGFIALLISVLAVIVTLLVTERIFERMSHIEDEMAYVWQAQTIAGGHLTLPSPPHPRSFLIPFVVDYHGQRFGKYPLGWPALLAVGVFFRVRWLVNPLLAGLGVWLTYRLGKRLFGDTVGLLSAFLTLTSPFFLMNSGSLLAHPFGLVLSSVFALTWLHAWDIDRNSVNFPNGSRNRWLPILTAALSLGLLITTRPMTAAGVALPFAIHGLYLYGKGDTRIRQRLFVFCIIILLFALVHFLWQYAVTGDPLLNPYTLWWKYDRVGFGSGFGHTQSGHTLRLAKINTRFSIWVGRHDLFGWGGYSWLFLPFGLLALVYHRNWKALLITTVIPSLVFVYIFYWIGSSLFGPRYYYEGLYSLTITSAAGVAFLAGWPTHPGMNWCFFTGWRKIRPLLVAILLFLLVCANLVYYTPMRLNGMYALYGVSRSRLEPFLTEQAHDFTPALVIVHPNKWTEYGSLLELQGPFLDTPFIFVISRGSKEDSALAEDFPNRRLIHYYPSQPYRFFLSNK